MTILWFLVWLFSGTPHVEAGIINGPGFNSWGVALAICVVVDIFKVK